MNVEHIDKYTCKSDVMNENTDKLSSRLEELEQKAAHMQEMTNTRLQEITKLLEKVVQHMSSTSKGDS